MNTLLLTGKIKVNTQVNIQKSNKNTYDLNKRLQSYIDTIKYYINESNFDNIVFCENSNYNFKQKKELIDLAESKGKKIEILQYEFNDEIKYGYHYGEAHIFDYAFKNSQLLKNSQNWYKITGRYKVLNINKILESYKNDDLYLYRGRGYVTTFAITTAFFKMNNDFYKKFLYQKQQDFYHIYKGEKMVPLEGVWYYLLKDELLKNYKTNTKEIVYFDFFESYIKILEPIKKHLGLLDFGLNLKILDKLLYKRMCRYCKYL